MPIREIHLFSLPLIYRRPNAVTQLQVVGESIGVPVFAPEPGNGVGDPVKVAKSGIEFAKSKQYNMVIVDTAGRLGY